MTAVDCEQLIYLIDGRLMMVEQIALSSCHSVCTRDETPLVEITLSVLVFCTALRRTTNVAT